MGVATVIDKVVSGNHDKTVILAVRQYLVQPFQAPDWLDLRVGFLLSLTKAADDDDPTGLAETITAVGGTLPVDDYYYLGLKDSSTVFPTTTGTVFIGYTNAKGPLPLKGDSQLLSSDIGIGTSDAYFWRPANGDGYFYCAEVYDGTTPRAQSTDGVQQHFAQDPTNAGGYATLLMMRLTRPTATSNVVTVTMKQGGAGEHSSDVLFTDVPTSTLLTENLESFPSTVMQLGPVTLSQVPTAFYLYWPFHSSRLRIHAMGLLAIS